MYNLGKRFLSFVLAVIMMMTLLAVSPMASSTVVELSADNTSAKLGDKITVTVNFAQTFDSAASLDVALKYDSNVLVLSSVTNGSAIKNARDAQDYDAYSENHSNPGVIQWALAGPYNYSFSGNFATVEFTVNSRASVNSTQIQFVVNDAYGTYHDNVASKLTSNTLNLSIVRSAENDMTFKLNSDSTGYIVTSYNSVDRSEIEMPNTHYDLPVVGIGNGVFMNHAEITSVTLPTYLETIEDNAFYSCNYLKEIVIPNTVTSIGANAFDDCTALKNITFSLSLKSIGTEAFKGCAVEEIRLPFSLTTIADKAFSGCSSLSNIYISKNTTSIGANAFEGCASSKTFYTVAANTYIDEYITTAKLNDTEGGLAATVDKTSKDISLGTAQVEQNVILEKGGVTPTVTITLNNSEAVTENTNYKTVYFNNDEVGTGTVYVVGINNYSEGYVLNFNITCTHKWEKTHTKNAKCLVNGNNHYVCSICGEEKDEVIPASGHTSGVWVIDILPTITTTGVKHKVCAVCKAQFESGTVIDKVYPDANGDKAINSSDALIVLQYTVGLEDVIEEDAVLQVDCNGDGKANSVDALTILRIAVGIIVL